MTNWNSLTWCWQYVSSLLALIKIVVASQHKRQRKKSLSRFVDSWKHRLGLESALATLCKWATCTRQTFKNLFLPYSLPSLWKIWQLSLFDHPTWCVWIRADICRWDGAICSKKNCPISYVRADFKTYRRSPSPIIAPGGILFGTAAVVLLYNTLLVIKVKLLSGRMQFFSRENATMTI